MTKITRDVPLENEYRNWLAEQPVDTLFDSNLREESAFAQFLKATNRAAEPSVGTLWWFDNAWDGTKNGVRIPTPIIAAEKAPTGYPYLTFGDAIRKFDETVINLGE